MPETIEDPENPGQFIPNPDLLTTPLTIPNPITALVHSKNWILGVIKDQILRYEANVASATATTTALNQNLSDIN